MPKFSVSLAGMVIEVNALFQSTEAFCREFLSEEKPALSVTIRQPDIEHEQSITESVWDPAYLETLALLRRIADKLINYNTILFHGSVLAVHGKAYIFTAPSGTGKTTHTKLWLESVPGAYVLNGDKPFLQIKDNQILACGSPWRGKENFGVNEILPLEAVCILERDTVNHIKPISSEKALGTLVKQTYRPPDSQLMLKALQLIGNVSQTVRLYRLGCNMAPEAARISSSAMIRT